MFLKELPNLVHLHVNDRWINFSIDTNTDSVYIWDDADSSKYMFIIDCDGVIRDTKDERLGEFKIDDNGLIYAVEGDKRFDTGKKSFIKAEVAWVKDKLG